MLTFYVAQLAKLVPWAMIAYVATVRAGQGRGWPALLQGIGAGLLAAYGVAGHIFWDPHHGILPRVFGTPLSPWLFTCAEVQHVVLLIGLNTFALGYLASYKGWWTEGGAGGG